MNGVCKLPRLILARFAVSTPDHIRIRRIGKTPGDSGLQAAAKFKEALDCPFAGQETHDRKDRYRS